MDRIRSVSDLSTFVHVNKHRSAERARSSGIWPANSPVRRRVRAALASSPSLAWPIHAQSALARDSHSSNIMLHGRLIFAVASLPWFALCVASFWMPSEAILETKGTANESEAADMALSEEGATSDPEAAETMDGEVVDESIEESLDAIGGIKIIRCKKSDRGIPCMMKCADEGISCAAKRPHPTDRNVGDGELGQCRRRSVVNSCWYHYPNGQLCVFVLWRSFCRVDND